MAIDTAEIEERGILLFRAAIVAGWIPHGESKDNGIDYRVELKQEGKASGVFFFVQLKAQNKTKLIQEERYASYNLEIERLKQYCNMRSPVYLVIADLHRNKCYFVFLQEYADKMRDQSWRKKGSGKVAIRVPTANIISALPGMAEEVSRALRYISSKLIREGISYDEAFYESMDGRYAVKLTATSKSKNFTIEAKEFVSINYKIDKTKLPVGEYDNFLRGLPMTVAPGAVRIEGSPLWEYIAAMVCEGGGQLIMAARREGHLSLSLIDSTGHVKSSVEYMPCVLEGGTLESRYSAHSPFNLIRVNGVVCSSELGQSSFHFKFNAGGWVNKRILELAYFEEIVSILLGHEIGDRLRVSLFFDGNDSVVMEIGKEVEIDSDIIKNLLVTLNRIRSICRHFGINPCLPEQFSADLPENLQFLTFIVNGQDIPVEAKFDSMTTTLSLAGATRLYRERDDGNLTNIVLVDSIIEKTIFGQTIIIESWRHVFSNLKLMMGYDHLKELIEQQLESVTLKFVPTEVTNVIITNSPEFDPSIIELADLADPPFEINGDKIILPVDLPEFFVTDSLDDGGGLKYKAT